MPFLFLLLVLPFIFSPPAVLASVSSCTANVSPDSVAYGDTPEFTFHITNPSDKTIVWINVSKPSSDYELTGCGGPWTCHISQSDANFPSVEIAAASGGTNGSGDITVSARMLENGGPSSDWTVQVSDLSNGSAPTNCSGTLSTNIVPNPAIAIGNVTVTKVSDTSVSVTWTTDTQTNSQIDYGLTTTYDLTKTDDTPVISHSLILSSLETNATYHVNISSTDYNGNSAQSGDFTFTTATSGTITITNTSIVTNTVTAADTTGPSVSLTPLASPVFSKPPAISGQAIDNTAVASAEYSLDQTTWYPITLDSKSVKSTGFKFTPAVSKSGSYTVKVRARDTAGNFGPLVSLPFSIDLIPPVITLSTSLSQSFPVSPQISGFASDKSGISLVEFSTDAGLNWQPAEIISHTATQTNFMFAPVITDDGDYPVAVRAADSLNNMGVTNPGQFSLVINRLPPRIGQFILTSGTQILDPLSDGNYLVSTNSRLELYISVIGGPKSVDLIIDGVNETLPLVSTPENHLWHAQFSVLSAGAHTLTVKAVDSTSTVQTLITTLVTRDQGSVTASKTPLPEAAVTAYVYDENTGSFSLWDGTPFGFDNPQKTDAFGKYSLSLPPGKYYLKITAGRYQTQNSDIFTLDHFSPITQNFSLSSVSSLALGPLTLRLPEFLSSLSSVPVTFNASDTGNVTATAGHPLTGLPFPKFKLASGTGFIDDSALHQKNTLVSFLPSWSPFTSAQLKNLSEVKLKSDSQIVVFAPHDSLQKTDIISHRLNLNYSYIADPDGELFNSVGLFSTPSFFLLDQHGIIIRTIIGELSPEAVSSLLN